ncbi:MAG: hypothetical protein K2L12_02090 [Clostridia bacterium]|nr:hypothetical protein [Clostridia bacterium]
MKKFLTALFCVITATVSLCFTACSPAEKGGVTVYAPDGAPALAIARLMAEDVDFGREVSYHIVDASEIQSTVTALDDANNADICILPVNAASKLLGNGERYQMLGVVTHGNLFIAANKDKADLTSANFAESLNGKKIGVVNLPAFPGSAFKLILNNYNLTESVTLENVAATAVSGTSTDFDYFVLPEPAASTRAGNANLELKIVGSLQSLYGENGYPQAVLVAKKSLIESDSKFIKSFMNEMKTNADWLMKEEVTAESIISAITTHYPENTSTTFNAKNLTKTVIEHCAIWFDDCTASSTAVNNFLIELKTAGDATATAVSDNFFYYG